ncbi:DUF3267 domain-containing protein [Natronobiforma cellulositropha]|uniref:DUF3267 domain-containing protein n=1 Tax=Natronobiforma cellulositropha TaxID=1679076 RepID=UPI0021D587DA|nr:DUF3267 domain-containing protein [Natronobiforma cellulositropha]
MTRTDGHPGEHAELLEVFTLTRPVAAAWVVVSTVGFFLAAYLFGLIYAVIVGDPLEPITFSVVSPLEAFLGVAVLLVLVGCVVIPHELLHGVAMAHYGGRPSYGVGVSYFVLPYAYARSDADYARNELLVVLLAPLVVISAVGVALMALVPSPLWIVPLAANAAGSVGDCWMAARLLAYPSSVRVGEIPARDAAGSEAGFAIYGSRAERRRPALASLASAFVTGGALTLVAVSLGLFALLANALVFGAGTVVIGDPGSFWFLFRHELDANGPGAHIEVGAPLLLALATGGGLLAALARVLRDS